MEFLANLIIFHRIIILVDMKCTNILSNIYQRSWVIERKREELKKLKIIKIELKCKRLVFIFISLKYFINSNKPTETMY